MINIDDVITGALVNVIAVAGHRVSVAVDGWRGRRRADDLTAARWFDTYRLTSQLPDLPDLSPALTEQLAAIVGGDEIQAALQELLAARLTDAPETDAARARDVVSLTLGNADFAVPLADYFDDQICALVARLERDDPSLLAQIRSDAFATRMISILNAVERHTAALDKRPARRTEATFLAGYRRHVLDQHGKLEPPDLDRRRRIPIADIYVPTVITEYLSSERAVVAGPEPVHLDLWQLAAQLDRSVLLGDPGGGKTTAATVLMHRFAGLPADGPVPFLVTLRDYAAADPPQRSVAGHIEHTLETFYQSPPPPGMVDLLLLTGRALVIFDGLDELLDTARRAGVTSRVERFCAEYPQAAVLVTSRLVGYDQARLDDRQFTCYRLGAFGADQVGAYAHKWFAQEEGVGEDEAEAFLTESASIPDLRTNPLLLSLMCILYRGSGSLPRDRAGLYEKCAHLLFDRWDARRHIHRELRAGHLLEPALRHLAWWLFTRDDAQSAVTERELLAETAEFLLRRGYEPADSAREAAREFVEFYTGRMWVFTDIGTTAAGERQYAFTHRTFLEYFAAEQLAFACDSPEKLARTLVPHVARREWGVVAELAVQIKDRVSSGGAERIYAALLGDRRHRSPRARCAVLEFLAQCLRSVDPSARRVRELTRELVGRLLAAYPDGDGTLGTAVCALFADGDAERDIIAAEVDAVAAEMISSDDPDARIAGLQFAIAMTDVRFYLTPWDDSPWDFWQAREAANLHRYTAALAAAAEADTYLRYRALDAKIITTRQALTMADGLSSLFEQTGSFVGTILYSPRLDNVFQAMLSGWPAFGAASVADDLAAVGEYLITHETAPWISSALGWWGDLPNDDLDDLASRPAVQPVKLSQDARLGAVAFITIATEAGFLAQLSKGNRRKLGPLSNLRPYLARRSGSRSTAELPDLPVPDKFKPIFRDWANGRIDLTS